MWCLRGILQSQQASQASLEGGCGYCHPFSLQHGRMQGESLQLSFKTSPPETNAIPKQSSGNLCCNMFDRPIQGCETPNTWLCLRPHFSDIFRQSLPASSSPSTTFRCISWPMQFSKITIYHIIYIAYIEWSPSLIWSIIFVKNKLRSPNFSFVMLCMLLEHTQSLPTLALSNIFNASWVDSCQVQTVKLLVITKKKLCTWLKVGVERVGSPCPYLAHWAGIDWRGSLSSKSWSFDPSFVKFPV